MTFDIEQHRRQRVADLQRRADYLEGERARLEQLLAVVLLMAARTIDTDWRLILDAACTLTDTNPAIAAIHQ